MLNTFTYQYLGIVFFIILIRSPTWLQLGDGLVSFLSSFSESNLLFKSTFVDWLFCFELEEDEETLIFELGVIALILAFLEDKEFVSFWFFWDCSNSETVSKQTDFPRLSFFVDSVVPLVRFIGGL